MGSTRRIIERSFRFSTPVAAGNIYPVNASDGIMLVDSESHSIDNPIIPAARRYSAWDTAGVTGGIPTRTTIHQTINSTGDTTNRLSTINSALSSCPDGQVVLLGNGDFTVSGGTLTLGNGVGKTLRGSGSSKILFGNSGSGLSVLIGNNSAGWNGAPDWDRGTPRTALSSSAYQGDTVINLGSTTNHAVNDIIWISIEDDLTRPVVQILAGPGYVERFVTKVIAKSSTTLTLKDPLPFDMPLSRDPQVHSITDGFAKRCGIEDVWFDFTNTTDADSVRLWNCDECWLYNVKITKTNNRALSLLHAQHCEIRKCELREAADASPNHAGILMEQSSLNLIVDNIIYKQYPHFEINFWCNGNVIAYNFVQNNSWGGTQGSAIDVNHGAHCAYNLFEGNCSPQLDSDGYFGSSSHETVFRNRLHGTNDEGTVDGDQYDGSHCVEANRLTRYWNVVENVLGASASYWSSISPSQTLKYELTASNTFGPACYRLGYPNTGNQTYTGTAQPSQGDQFADWTDYLSGGCANTVDFFQERDLDVEATMLRKGNYNAVDSGVRAGESISGYDAAPDSYFLASKPSWFFGLDWPPYGTGGSTAFDVTSSFQLIPAGYRFYNSNADPPA